ncbi:hypothetical protein V6N13_047741 [Hibiscus sabdariffa]|uniref:Uncharacterized protein n=2 Tax=Hibiscus sabdariffa TaxID=183260 RepID=A0ABR1Z9L6_9ROSI
MANLLMAMACRTDAERRWVFQIATRGIAPIWVFQIPWSKSGSRNGEGKIRWSTTLASLGLMPEWQQRRRCLVARVCSSSPSALSKEKNETNGADPPP